MSETTAVFVDSGSGEDFTGDEVREFYVTPGDDDGEPTGESTTFRSRGAAEEFAEKLAAKFGGVEVVHEGF